MTILRATGTDLDVEESGQGRDLLLLHSLLTDRGSFARVVPTLMGWTDVERGQCAYFAAVTLDRRIAFSRDMLAQQIDI